MNSNIVAPAVILIGILLIVLSFVWPAAGISSGGWAEEKAARKTELVRYQHGGGGNLSAKELVAATKELDQLNAELKVAQDNPASVAAMFRWAGAGVTLLGIVVFLSQREK